MAKIIQVVSSIDESTGGPARSVTNLIKSINDENEPFQIDLYTGKSSNPLLAFNNDKKSVINFYKKNKIGFSKLFVSDLKNSKGVLFHGHGIWLLPVHFMSKIARKLDIPYVITPRGMLEPWSLSQSSLRKKIALKFFQYKDLANSACIHATAPMEVASIRSLGFKNPIAMIPNGVNISEFSVKVPLKSTMPRKILFLSRIHVKKGIENLLEAWQLIPLKNRRGWKIEIVGNGDEVYIQSLKNKIISEKLNGQIEIKKPVFGEEKIKLFREASLFVLPSFSENFGIVIAEALASYTPVITTKGTPWEELNKENAGWWINIGVEPLKKALEEAIGSSDKTFIEMGANGRKLVEDKYSMESVGKQMIHLYNWILNKGVKPKFIDFF